MIEEIIAENKDAFADYDVNAIRQEANYMDRQLQHYFEEILALKEITGIHQKIDQTLSVMNEVHGEKIKNFYETVYGFFLVKVLERDLSGDDSESEQLP